MLKKVIGGLFLAGALLLIISNIITGSFFEDRGSTVATYGYFVGKIVPIVLYVISGFFLLNFEKPCKKAYIEGFKIRGRQNAKMLPFAIIYAVLMILSAIGEGLQPSEDIITGFLAAYLPFCVPFVIFVFMVSYYSVSHKKSKTFFVSNAEALNYYLGSTENYKPCAADNSVLASDKALYFSKLFCVVPFNQIKSIKPTKELGIQYVYFYLNNGKKFYVATKYYNEILAEIETRK